MRKISAKRLLRLITGLATLVLAALVFAVLTSSGSDARAAVDAKVYVANEWSKLTNDPAPQSGYTYAGSGKTIYSTFVEVDTTTGPAQNTIQGSADRVTIFVEDSDANVAVAKSKTLSGSGQLIGSNTFGDQATVILGTADSPIVDTNGDGFVFDDVTIDSTPAGSIGITFATPGSPTVPATISLIATGTQTTTSATLSWKTSATDSVVVKVWTTQDVTGKTFSINETGVSTGVFKGQIDLRDEQNSAPGSSEIKVRNGSTVTVTYTDTTPASGSSTAKAVSSTATVESVAPLATITAPTTGGATQDLRPEFAGSVSDSLSGLDISEIAVYVDTADDSTNQTAVSASKSSTTDKNSPVLPASTADGDTSTTFSVTPAADLPKPVGSLTASIQNHIVDWQVQATDLAGNIGWSDSSTTEANVSATVAGQGVGKEGRGQPYTVKIDRIKPDITEAYTGFYLDSTVNPAVRKTDKKTSIEIDFNDNIDATSVRNTDFEVVVGGVIQVPTDAVTGGTGFADRVFLTLGSDLGSKDTPTVKIVGPISDAAGNTTSGGSKVSKDALAPTITVALSGGTSATAPSTLTRDKMTVTVSSDEPLSSNPLIDLYDQANATTAESSLTALSQGGNIWIATFSKGSSLGGDSTTPGGFKKSLVVTANDAVSLTTAGLSTGTTVPSGTVIGQAIKGKKDDAAPGAVLFTLDTRTPQLTLSPSSDTSDNSPFVSWNFGEVVTVSLAEFGLSSGTGLDDVTTELTTNDDQTYIYVASDLVPGEYKAMATATDLAGNKTTGLFKTFKVIERAEFRLTLLPGTTLVSFPSEPFDSRINTVFSPAGIVSVSSFDAVGGAFTSAVRDSDSGELSGSLENIESGVGYVVVTDGISPMVVQLLALGASSVPPVIPLAPGWNLVGATDVTGDANGKLRQPPSTITPRSDYFPARVTQVYNWDATAHIWKTIADDDNVIIGEAYWAFATAADVIVP